MSIAFDKTNTLTYGRPEGRDVISFDASIDENTSQSMVASAEAKGMIDRLHSMNTDIVLLTSDNQKPLITLPNRLASNRQSAAPALKKANVGVAMGALGSDIAVEAAVQCYS